MRYKINQVWTNKWRLSTQEFIILFMKKQQEKKNTKKPAGQDVATAARKTQQKGKKKGLDVRREGRGHTVSNETNSLSLFKFKNIWLHFTNLDISSCCCIFKCLDFFFWFGFTQQYKTNNNKEVDIKKTIDLCPNCLNKGHLCLEQDFILV